MSLMRPVLNTWLRHTEKPHMRRTRDPTRLRRSFEAKARLFFHAPRGSRKTEKRLGGVPVLEITPRDDGAGVLFYLHGGAYVFGSPRTHWAMVAMLARLTRQRAVLPDYRKAPEHPFPAAPEDALAAWDGLMATGVDPARVTIGGDSAGGGLALALLGQLVARGGPLPAGVFAFSPLTDMSYSAPSITANAASDVVLPAEQIGLVTGMVLAGADPHDPRASPLHADFTGGPPVWLAASDSEILLDDSRRMAERLTAQGVVVTLTIARDLPHAWPIFHNILPEARQTLRDLAAWIRALPSPSPGS